MLGLLKRSRPAEGDDRDGRMSPELDAAELRCFPELVAAIKGGRASFDTYVRARFLANPRFNSDQASREVYGRWRTELLDAFQEESGRICGSYYCDNLIGATARTNRPRFALVFNSHSWGKEEELLTSCDGLYWEGIDYVAGTDRVTFVERLYSVAADVLGVLDSRCIRDGDLADGRAAGAAELRGQALEALGRKLQDVRAFYMKAAKKRAKLRYLAGVAAGTAATIALSGLLFLVLLAAEAVIEPQERAEIIAIWIAGAVGAVVSVLQRVSSNSLELHHEAGKAELALIGAIRPLLGGALGVALYSMFAGGILDFALPNDSHNEIYFYAGVGFLSGFSERFAQDMLVQTSNRFTQAR